MKLSLCSVVSASALMVAASARAFDTCETVMVGGVRVNRDDYDADQAKPAKERQYGAVDSAAKQEAAADAAAAADPATLAPGVLVPPAPAAPDLTSPDAPPLPTASNGVVTPAVVNPGGFGVLKDGKKFFVVVPGTGAKITDNPAIEAKGYEAEKDAWDAIIAATPH